MVRCTIQIKISVHYLVNKCLLILELSYNNITILEKSNILISYVVILTFLLLSTVTRFIIRFDLKWILRNIQCYWGATQGKQFARTN